MKVGFDFIVIGLRIFRPVFCMVLSGDKLGDLEGDRIGDFTLF